MEAAAATLVEASLPKRDASEERFVFTRTRPIASLQLMASYRVAWTLWYRYIRDTKRDGVIKEGHQFPKIFFVSTCEAWELVEQLKIPNTIKGVILKSQSELHGRMKKWIDYCYNILSTDFNDYRIVITNENWFVWRSDSEIDVVGSARKMIHSEGIGDVQKFALMCHFCLEDELQTIDVHSLPADFCDRVTFDKDILCFYWLKRLKNKLDEVPLENYDSVDVAMAANCEYRCWEAFEYFLDRLGYREQVEAVVGQLSAGMLGWRFLPQVMRRLSSSQQLEILYRIPCTAVLNYLYYPEFLPQCIKAWNMIKNKVPVNDFIELMSDTAGDIAEREESMRLLNELWDSAPSQHKRSFVEDRWEKTFWLFYNKNNNLAPSALTLLCKVLSLKTPTQRKQIMYQWGEKLTKTVLNAWSLDEVVKMCLPDDEERIEFKFFIMKSPLVLQNAAFSLYRGEFQRVKSMLQYYARDPNTAQEFVRCLLRMKVFEKTYFLLDYYRWIKLREFIDELYFDGMEAMRIKKEFVSKFAIECRVNWNDDKSLNAIINVVGEVLDDEEIVKFKGDLITSFKKRIELYGWLYWPFFEEKYFLRFVQWCLKDEDECVEFRRTIQIDDIFDCTLKTICHGFWDRHQDFLNCIEGLNKCLRWYLGSKDEANEYKLQRVCEIPNAKLIRHFYHEKTPKVWAAWLERFFEGDVEMIRRFGAKRGEYMSTENGFRAKRRKFSDEIDTAEWHIPFW